jgi:hypothetical protein
LLSEAARGGFTLTGMVWNGHGRRGDFDPTDLTCGSNANFLVVFHAGGAAACNHIAIAGGVAEAPDRQFTGFTSR